MEEAPMDDDEPDDKEWDRLIYETVSTLLRGALKEADGDRHKAGALLLERWSGEMLLVWGFMLDQCERTIKAARSMSRAEAFELAMERHGEALTKCGGDRAVAVDLLALWTEKDPALQVALKHIAEVVALWEASPDVDTQRPQ